MGFLPFPAPSIGFQVVCSFLINCVVFPFLAVNIPSPLMKVEDVRTLARKGAVY
jgi:hypothetical protein